MRQYMRIAATCAATALFVGLSAQASHAQSFVRLVWNQLDAMYETANRDGYSSRNYIIGALDDDKSEFWTLQFCAGNTYMLRGVCDADCSDIDLLVTRDQDAVASDTAGDDHPTVTFYADRDASYTIEVKMYSCSTEPCYFGVGVFFK